MLNSYYYDIDLFRKYETQDTRGGATAKYGETEVIQGLINPTKVVESKRAGNDIILITAKLFTDIEVELRDGDIVKTTGEADYYRVITPPQNTVKRNHHLVYLLENIEGGAIEFS